MKETTACNLTVSDETGNIFICVARPKPAKDEILVHTYHEDITQECICAVLRHLVIGMDKANSEQAVVVLVDSFTNKKYQLDVTRIPD